MSFLPATNRSGILAGVYLVNAVVAPLTVFYSVSTHWCELLRCYSSAILTRGPSGQQLTLAEPPSVLLPRQLSAGRSRWEI
jgi:hypothetical protein